VNDLSFPGDRRMTVKEVAEALGVDHSTVSRHLNAIRIDLCNVAKVENGKAASISEAEATEIKRRIERSGRNDLANVREVSQATTPLEIAEMTLRVIAYHKDEADRLRRELADAQPKIESAEAIAKCETAMSITDAAKHFGLHPKLEVFPYLRARGYLTREDLPTQAAIDQGYLALRQNPDRFGVCHPQAVVLTWQLENWRAHVVRQVKAWTHEAVS